MDSTFASRYDADTSTLELTGPFDRDSWSMVHEEVERAFRRTASRLTIDMTRATGVPAHFVGQLVHLCNCCYPGTIVWVAAQRNAPAA
jgi:ABC-type transporter Mla MlaB component